MAVALSRLSLSGKAEWLPPGNPYTSAAQDEIEGDGDQVPVDKEAAFADYLAAGAFVHCGDAWSYIGRAIDSLIRGDLHSAVHLTYYAELRGAISLLASEGIYIGNRNNFVITQSGAVQSVTRDGTHIAAWKYLAAWNESSRASDLLGQVLRPGGLTLDTWLANAPNGGIGPIVSDLFTRMAFDLQSFSDDRERRNAASYNPSRLTAEDLDVSAMCRLIANIWTSLEPDTRGGFPVLDNLLLRNILTSLYEPQYAVLDDDGNTTGEINWSQWERWLGQVLPTQSSSTALSEQLGVIPSSSSVDSVLSAAFGNDALESPVDFIEGMMARTTILLRLATGSCIRLLEDSGLSGKEIDPWVNSLGLARGLWDPKDMPEDKLDLWADTELARDSIELSSHLDPYGILESLKSHAIVLGQAERVVAWSFS